MDEQLKEHPPTPEAWDELTNGKEEGRDGEQSEQRQHPQP